MFCLFHTAKNSPASPKYIGLLSKTDCVGGYKIPKILVHFIKYNGGYFLRKDQMISEYTEVKGTSYHERSNFYSIIPLPFIDVP